MQVKRIVTNIATQNLAQTRAFYADIFGLEVVMDFGWIQTFSSGEKMTTQLSIASEGGSGTPVPNISIEVDDLEVALERVNNANMPIEYGPVSEPWGVRRFYVRDPAGTLLNVVTHE